MKLNGKQRTRVQLALDVIAPNTAASVLNAAVAGGVDAPKLLRDAKKELERQVKALDKAIAVIAAAAKVPAKKAKA